MKGKQRKKESKEGRKGRRKGRKEKGMESRRTHFCVTVAIQPEPCIPEFEMTKFKAFDQLTFM